MSDDTTAAANTTGCIYAWPAEPEEMFTAVNISEEVGASGNELLDERAALSAGPL